MATRVLQGHQKRQQMRYDRPLFMDASGTHNWHGKLCRHVERVSSESWDIGSRSCAVWRELWMCRKRHGRLIILCPPRESVFPRCTVSYCHDLQGATGHSNVWDAQILLQGLWSYATWMRSNNRPTLPTSVVTVSIWTSTFPGVIYPTSIQLSPMFHPFSPQFHWSL